MEVNWLWDVARFVPTGASGPGWTPWCRALTQSSHVVIAVAALTIGVSLWRCRAPGKADRAFAHSWHCVAAMLLLCALTHLDEVLALDWPNPAWFWFAVIETAAALFAALAAWRLPRPLHLKTRAPSGGHEVNVPGAATTTADSGDDERQRYKRLKVRVTLMEDTCRRNRWIQQSQSAVRHLNDLLSELETVLEEHPATGRDSGQFVNFPKIIG